MLLSRQIIGENGNIIAGIWELLFSSPQGLVFIMPVVTMIPLGIIVMWRNEMHSLTIISGGILLYTILIAAAGICPVSGESVGARQLLPVVPLMILPLAFLWREQAGEKIWLVAVLALTVYMCSFGWWAGFEKGRGMFIGSLHDRNARDIILAKKNMIGRPEHKSSGDLADLYMKSIETRNMKLWLQIIDRESLSEIEGLERIVFSELCLKFKSGKVDNNYFIESVDPNRGVRPVLPIAVLPPKIFPDDTQ